MKHFFLLCITMLSIGCTAQSLKTKEISKDKLSQFVGSISEYKAFALKNNYVRTVIVSNAPGSSGEEGTHTVSRSLYISNCQDGDGPVCKLYVVENLLALKVESVTENKENVIVEVSYGNAKDRKTDKITFPLSWQP